MVKVGVLNKEPDLGGDTTVAEAASFEADKHQMKEGKRPQLGWDMTKVEWIGWAAEGAVEDCGRCTRCLRNPNGASSGWARQDRPSSVIVDEICSGHAAMCDRPLGQKLRMLPGQTAKASQDRGGQLVGRAASAVAGMERVRSQRMVGQNDLRTTAQFTSSPGRDERAWKARRKAMAWSPKWDAGREPQAARRQASPELNLTMEPETAIRSRTRAT